MNCKSCNVPGAPHELIGELCHPCCDRIRAEALTSVIGVLQFNMGALVAQGQTGETFEQMWERVLAERQEALAGWGKSQLDVVLGSEPDGASLLERLRLAELAASDNADWFDSLVGDLAKLLGCEAKATAVIAAVQAKERNMGGDR